jgi:ribosomal protein S1
LKKNLKPLQVDQKVSGTVAKILSSGVLVSVGEGIEGFIKKDKIPANVTYNEGSPVSMPQ